MIVGLISSNYYPPAPTITLSPATLTTPTYGAYYSANIVASGGFAPYSYTVSSGTLPPGLTLDSSTGALTGYSGTGSFSFTIRATDRAGYYAEQSYAFELYNKTSTIDYLVVAGGGGGGGSAGSSTSRSSGGGGGAGGYKYGTLTLNTITELLLEIGAGGAGGYQPGTTSSAAIAGGNSSIAATGLTTITANGGGTGASGTFGVSSVNGGAGGSGGGASTSTSSTRGTGGTGISGQGFAGGAGALLSVGSTDVGAGGGGGAGGSGGGGFSTAAGSAGAAATKTVAGSNFTFSGGGPGGYSVVVSDGAVATGYGTGGRGARRSNTSFPLTKGETGAPGVIILWYPNTYDQLVNLTGAYTYENVGGYHKYTITSVGTSSVTI